MSTAYIQANTHGRLHDAREASITPLDRSFLYGDAIYEVWRTWHGVAFGLVEHWERLERSARALHLDLPMTRDELLAQIRRTIAAYRERTGEAGPCYVRLQVSRGAGPIGLDPVLADEARWVLLVRALPPSAPRPEGLTLSIGRELRRNPPESLDPAWKTGNYLNNLLGLREARARGADEVLLLNLRGDVTEAAVANVAFVREGRVFTPPRSAGILAGVTRRLLLEQVGPRCGVEVVETEIRPENLGGFEECFLLSTTKDVAAVGRIDGQRFAVGSGTIAQRLKAGFADYARAYAAAHPEFAVE